MNRCSLQHYNLIYITTLCYAIFASNSLMAETHSHGSDNTAAAAHTDVHVKKSETVAHVAENPHPPRVTLPSDLDFSKFTHAGFLKLRRDLIDTVYESNTGLSSSQETTDALLSLAELYLAHAMAVEGQSIVFEYEGKTLTDKQSARIATLAIAVHILDPWDMALSEASILLLEGSDKWPRHALFKSLYFARKNAPEKARVFLAEAAEDILVFPEPIKEIALPNLLNAAIDLGDWKTARRLAEAFVETPRLNKGSAYHYFLGRTAENGHDYLVAFDHYVKATAGLDHWSQLASLSLVKMGTATKTLTPQDTRALLEQIRFAWRGTALSSEVFKLLVMTELSLNDIPAALEVLGEIIYINDDTDAVKAAKEKSDVLLTSFYTDGASGEISLGKFMNGHKRITQDYRFHKGFDQFSEKFADRLFAIGATNEAAFEYKTTYNYLSVAQDLGLFEVTPEQLDKLHLKQATALMRGGQYDLAEPILTFGPESTDPKILDQFTFLKAEVFTQTGKFESILETQAHAPSIDYLRIKADAYFSMEDWQNAAKTYCIIWKRMENDLLFTDTLNLFLSAYRNNDSQLTIKLAKAFPDLTKIPQWQQIADWLAEDRNAINVLQKDTITTDISNASRVLDVMEIINTSSQ